MADIKIYGTLRNDSGEPLADVAQIYSNQHGKWLSELLSESDGCAVVLFDGMVRNVALESSSSSTPPGAVYWDSGRNTFVGKSGAFVDAGGLYYQMWTGKNEMYPVDKEHMYVDRNSASVYLYKDGSMVEIRARQKWIDVLLPEMMTWDADHIENELSTLTVSVLRELTLGDVVNSTGVHINADGYHYYLRWKYVNDDCTEMYCDDLYFDGSQFRVKIEAGKIVLKYIGVL